MENRCSRFAELDKLCASGIEHGVDYKDISSSNLEYKGLPIAAIAKHRKVGRKNNHPLRQEDRRRIYLAETGRM